MPSKNYYEILGVDKQSSDEDIKKAYRKLAMKYHPDRFSGASEAEKKNAENKFKEISEAYSVLSDKNKRQQYDNFGSDFANKSGGFSDFNVNDIFNQFFGEDSSFSDFFGGSSSRKTNSSQKGENLKITIKATLEEIALGAKKKINLSRNVSCKWCHGTGSLDSKNIITCKSCKGSGYTTRVVKTVFGSMTMSRSVCPDCNGTGKINLSPCSHCRGEGREKIKDTIEIEIPAGIQENMQFIVKGKGNAGQYGGICGDLYVQVLQADSDKFFRKGADIYTKLTISFPEAALGTEKIVDTLYGKIKIKIKAGTQSGTYLKISNKGMKDVNGYGYGSQYVYIQVYVPTSLNKEESSYFKKLINSENFKPQDNKTEKNFFSKIKDWF